MKYSIQVPKNRLGFWNDTCGSQFHCAVPGQTRWLIMKSIAGHQSDSFQPDHTDHLQKTELKDRELLASGNLRHPPCDKFAYTQFMPAMDFLEFNHQFQVLICLQCRYAVQKTALESHLLRHKIYRGERRRLLLSLSEHPILDPDDVQVPTPDSQPIDGLPIIQGYRCTSPGCDSKCASIKRMRRHWSESHGISDPPESCSRPASLQTFFRGTKLRYFEVLTASSDTLSASPTSTTSTSTFRPTTSAENNKTMDMEMLKYFHHFITITATTLPVGVSGRRSAYWQTHVVTEALSQDWLMSGLLGIASSHLAATSDTSDRQPHLDQAARYFIDFDLGYQRSISSLVSNIRKLGTQIESIHQCCSWLADSPVPSTPFTLQTLFQTIQGLAADPEHPPSNSSDSRPEPPGDIDPTKVPPELFQRLQSLPYQMSLAVGKPKTTLDFLSTLSAVDSLTLSFYWSYSEETADSAWRGMVTWLEKISGHFAQLVCSLDTAALIVFWHWSFLVDRAEGHFWFLEGLGGRIRRHVLEHLPRNDGIRRLVGE